MVLPKPQHEDVARMHAGQVLWGWPHCVQDPTMTQLAIDRELTLIAFEAMNHWTSDGHVGLHVFHKNNELAGYCSVLQAMELVGITGDYGRRLSAVVIGFGATARGAVTALKAHGVGDVAVLTTRGVAAVGSPIHSVRIRQFDHDPDGAGISVVTDRGREPLAPYLAENDIVVNCTLQDTAAPLTYLRTEDLAAFRNGQPDRGRVVRRGDGLLLGRADHVRRPDVHRRRPRPLLRGRPQPVVPLELGHVGEQRGAAAVRRAGAERAGGVGRVARPSAGPSRSATDASATPRSWRSRAVRGAPLPGG